ncbi:CBS domain-containing protein [Amycolatopsis aidingensis]|uniref:CBS domain-containing protein n=1 Tax=Amycolatopsis aidingensis TaxID=2842453 RepID=UPI001C0B5049|nr:CBS domain-containing protein [Amycolatopsis aidingensis]
MDAQDIMSRPVTSISPDTSIQDAIALLLQHGFAALPVADDDKVVGIFTEADAIRGAVVAGSPRVEQAVSTVMTTPVEVVSPDTDVERIARHMLTDRLRCLPVVSEGTLVGVISRRDLLRPLVRQDDAIAAQIRALLTDYSGHRDHWTAGVAGGVATIRGSFTDEAERRTLVALARTVPGVVRVELALQRTEV